VRESVEDGLRQLGSNVCGDEDREVEELEGPEDWGLRVGNLECENGEASMFVE